MLLHDRIAYVSGGAGAIGSAIAARLCEEGARVVLGDVLDERAEIVARDLRGRGHDARAIRHDVTDSSATEAALAAVLDAHGHVDIACANAGVGHFASVLDMQDADWERVLAINTTGVMRTLRTFGRAMAERGSGSLVVTASISSLRGAPLLGAYCASKFAVIGLAESMAKEVAGRGVRVNCVCPGPVEGEIAAEMVRRSAAQANTAEAVALAELTAPIALGGRLVRPREVADAVVFLASDRAGFVTGQRLVVDGGMLAK